MLFVFLRRGTVITLARNVIKTLVLLALILVLIGLVAKQHYRVERSITLDVPSAAIKPWLWDLTQWQQWLALRQFDQQARLEVRAQAQGVGAHLGWQGQRSQGELSIVSDSASTLNYQLLVNNEYLSHGQFQLISSGERTRILWQQQGEITLPVIGPYLVWFTEHTLANTMTHSLNNLKTVVELEHKDEQ
ncbi:hypothetical protein CWC31_02350 [Pseudoalteromonas ruthenica]|nr:hypothetical protein CWC31_02350 [Pseudoalteromonas ruthenica]TMO48323.1 hypothetical protein CWC24_05130 [Pseudoalteromonas ruthenica]TMO52126.1 hypothetical protein CWC23_04215 [Pseudoalteromonas ruthenica]